MEDADLDAALQSAAVDDDELEERHDRTLSVPKGGDKLQKHF